MQIRIDFLQRVGDVVRHTSKLPQTTQWSKTLSRYQFGALDFYIRQSEVDTLDYFKQSLRKLSELTLSLRHYRLQGACIVAASLSKHLFHLHSPHEFETSTADPFYESLFDKVFTSLTHILTKRSLF